MEIFLCIAVVVMLLLLLGVDLWYFLIIGIGIVALLAGFCFLFFAVCTVMLIRSRKHSGMFLRFEESGRFSHAVYLIDGKEYSCIFPAEMILRDKLYKELKPITLRLGNLGKVFDKNAFLTVLLGLPMSLIIMLIFAGGVVMLLNT